jgi:hypothetical protein
MLVLFGALVLLAALLLAPGLAVGPSLDAAVFTGIAHELLDGGALYVDAWDHKPPGAYVVFLIGQAAMPWLLPWLAVWLISVIATAGTGLGIAYALAALGVRRWSVLVITAGSAVALMAQYLTALGGGLTEPLAALPAAWALVVALSHPQGWIRFATIGSLLGIAALISFQVAPGVLAIGGLSLAVSGAGRRWRALGSLAAGAVVPWLLTGVALQATGALEAAVDAVIGYGAAYRAASAAYGAELSRAPAAWTFLSALFLVTSASLGGLALRRTGGNRRWVLYAMVGWIAAALVLFVYQGRFIAHYAIPLAIPLGVLAGVGIEATVGRWGRSRSATRVPLALPLVAALIVSAAAAFFGGRYELAASQARSDRIAAASRYVAEQTNRGDSILVWGNRPELYLAADRPSAMRYSFMYPLTTEGYVTADLVDQVRNELAVHPPILVVDAGSDEPGAPGFLPLLIDRPVAREGREVDLLQPLRDFIGANYDLVAEIGGWPVYQLRTVSGSGGG